jgi:N-acetylglutamate synthase-like GNAT family acetyltransferase
VEIRVLAVEPAYRVTRIFARLMARITAMSARVAAMST